MNDLTLKIHSLGFTSIPPENPTMQDYKKYFYELLSLEHGMTVAIRFEIGNTLLDIGLEHGEKFAFCEKHFGAGQASMMMEAQKVAREWVFNQNVGWSWSHYKAIYTRPKEEKLELIKQYNQRKIRSVDELIDAGKRIDAANGIVKKEAKRSQIVHVDDLKEPDNNVIEAEYKPAAPSLPPPPNTVNPGPWCECGEPALPDSKFCPACWKSFRERDIQKAVQPPAPPVQAPPPVIGFKVEGDTVHRQELRFASPASDIPPYLRQTPPPGLKDNGRDVIGAVCAMECDTPEVIYVRCVVPPGMTLSGNDMFTVALVRCQLP
jgi:hypothetical protein